MGLYAPVLKVTKSRKQIKASLILPRKTKETYSGYFVKYVFWIQLTFIAKDGFFFVSKNIYVADYLWVSNECLMNLALRIQEAYKHDMAYAEPTNFESNFAKKMDGLLNEALNVLYFLKVLEFSALILLELFYSEEINIFLH